MLELVTILFGVFFMASSESQIVDQYGTQEHKYIVGNSMSMGFRKEVLFPFCEEVANLNCGAQAVGDIASGAGLAAGLMRLEFERLGTDYRIIETDISELGLSLSKGERARALAQELPFKKEGFRALLFKDAMVHIPKEERNHLFEEFGRVLAPGGILLVVTQRIFPGFYTYCVDGGDNLRMKLILNKKQYLRSKSEKESDPRISEIGPPYYTTTPFLVTQNAKNAGLILLSQTSWQPQRGETEWHDDSVKRSVMLLQKA